MLDPDVLLCEACGYPLAGLSHDRNCPECGQPVRESLPEARTGSDWQRRPSIGSYFGTNLAALRRPGSLFRSVAIESRPGTGLLVANLLLAGLIVVSPWYGTIIGDPTRQARMQHRHEWVTAAWVIPLQVGAVAAVLGILTLTEWAGIQFYARRRGHRLTPTAAWQICAHASIGWVLASGLALLGLLAWPIAQWMGFSGAISRIVGDWILIIPPAAGAAAGLLVFETLVWIGVGRCRYANRPTRGGQTAAAA